MTQPRQNGFSIADWRASPTEGLLARGDEVVRLEPKAMEVLVYFASRPNEVISREDLERDVWHGALVGYDAVTNTVIKLRKALQDDARQPRFIVTIPKKGYQLIAPITYPEERDNPAVIEQTSTPPDIEVQQKRPPRPARKTSMAGVVLVIAAVLGLAWLWQTGFWQQDGSNSTTSPSIVVLPFENLSDDPKQDYLADGITEDIITDLSRLSNILVIASNTSSSYKSKQIPLEKIGTELNVGYVLKGTIRQLGNEARVNVQLVNAKTGFNTWAQRYDRNLTELFTVQDEVTQSIAKALAVKISAQEKQRLTQRATDNLKAYDFFQEGQRLYKINTKEANEQAREMYSKAIDLDPGYGRAYGALATILVIDFRRGWTDAPIETLNRALELANKAVSLDNSTPQTYWALGFVHLSRKEFDKAEMAVEKAISIAPNYADGYGLLALINSFQGKAGEAIILNNKAIRYNPFYSFEYLISYGLAYYTLGNYDTAIKTLEEARERNENSIPVKLLLAASYVKANQQDNAEWMINEVLMLNPKTTTSDLEKTFPVANPDHRHALLADLRKAGLPE